MSYIALASLLLSSAAALTVGEGYGSCPQYQVDGNPEFLFAKRIGKANVFWYGHFQVPGHLALNSPVRYDFHTHDVLVSSGSTTPMDFKLQGKIYLRNFYQGTYDCELTGKIEGIQLRGIRLQSSERVPFAEFSRGIIKSPKLQCESSNAAGRNYIMNVANQVLANLDFHNSGVALPSFILKRAESIFIHQHLQQHVLDYKDKLTTFRFKLTILSVDGIYNGKVQKMSVSTTDENPETVSVTGELKYASRLRIRVAGQGQWTNTFYDVKGDATLLNANATVIAEHKKTFSLTSLTSNAVIKPRSFIIRGELDRNSVHFYSKHSNTRVVTKYHFIKILEREGIVFTDTS